MYAAEFNIYVPWLKESLLIQKCIQTTYTFLSPCIYTQIWNTLSQLKNLTLSLMDKDSGPYSMVITRVSDSATDSMWVSVEVNDASRGQLNLSMEVNCRTYAFVTKHCVCIKHALIYSAKNRIGTSVLRVVFIFHCYVSQWFLPNLYILCFLRYF